MGEQQCSAQVNKIEETPVQIALSNYTAVVVTNNQHVYTWGRGSEG